MGKNLHWKRKGKRLKLDTTHLHPLNQWLFSYKKFHGFQVKNSLIFPKRENIIVKGFKVMFQYFAE